jgi:hypothetical protein
LKPNKRGTFHVRMVWETVLSMLTTVSHFKQNRHRLGAPFLARLAFTVAMFNMLVQWNGLPPDEDGVILLSIAQCSLEH